MAMYGSTDLHAHCFCCLHNSPVHCGVLALLSNQLLELVHLVQVFREVHVSHPDGQPGKYNFNVPAYNGLVSLLNSVIKGKMLVHMEQLLLCVPRRQHFTIPMINSVP